MRRVLYGSIQVNGLRINYYRTGEEKPPVVMLHGLADSALAWNRLPVELEPEFDVVLIDARGHGFSAATESGYGPQEQAEDVRAVIRELRLDRPAIIGHSMGAEVAAVLAASLPPGSLRGLVLEDPPWPPETLGATPEVREMLAAALVEYLRAQKARPLDELVQQALNENPRWHSTEGFQWAKAKQQARPQISQYLTAPHPALNELLPRLIKLPGLIVTGDPRLGALFSPQAAEQVAKLWPQAQVVQMEEAGHAPHREQYRPFLQLVRRFLRRALV